MTEKFNISKNIIEKSKMVSSRIDDEAVRKRVFALNIAANTAAEYMTSAGLETDTNISLYKIASFAKNLEMADIYINGIRLDVRLTFDGKTFCIPKIQEKYDAKPYAYIVVQLEKNLSAAQIVGFVPADELEKVESDNEYLKYEVSVLKPIRELRVFLSSLDIKQPVYSVTEHEKIKELCISFIDEELSESEKVYFIKHVIACPVCRETFCDMNDFNVVVSQVKNYPDLIEDKTLSVLSGNKEEIHQQTSNEVFIVENSPELEQENVVSEQINEQDTELEEIEELVELNDAEELLEEIEEPKEEFVQDTVEEPMEQTALESQEKSKEELQGELQGEPKEEILFEENTLDEQVEEPIEETVEKTVEEPALVEETQTELSQTTEDTTGAEDDLFALAEDYTEPQDDSVVEEVPSILPMGAIVSEIQEQEVLEEENKVELSQEVENHSLDEIHTEDKHHEIAELEEEELVMHDDSEDDLLLEEHHPIELLEEEKEEKPSEAVKEEVKSSQNMPLQDELIEHEELIEVLEEEDLEQIEELTELDEAPTLESESKQVLEAEPKTISYVKEPIELVYDDEEKEEKPIEIIDDAVDKQEQEKEEEKPFIQPIELENEVQEDTAETEVNDEIQKLLDDDLLALLSEDSPSETTTSSAQVTPEVSMGEQVVQPRAPFADFEENEGAAESIVQEQQTIDSVEDDGLLNDDEIESLYGETTVPNPEAQEDSAFELAQEPVSETTVKATKRIVTLLAIFLLLLGSSAFYWFTNYAKTQDNTADASSDSEFFDMQNKVGAEDKDVPAVSQDINKSMTNSFSDKPAAITITKLSWQISEKLAVENSVKEYLQTAGKNIQMNLQNDLLNAADINFNNVIKVSFEIAPDNTLKGLQILESSGSDQVDEIVARSIKNTLKYVSVPKLKDFNSDYFLTLIINF